MKFRFFLNYTNSRGSNHGASLSAGDSVHPRGWNAGVRVVPRGPAGGRDTFDVWMTPGSHDAGHSVQLGTVHDTPDGPRWIPADLS